MSSTLHETAKRYSSHTGEKVAAAMKRMKEANPFADYANISSPEGTQWGARYAKWVLPTFYSR